MRAPKDDGSPQSLRTRCRRRNWWQTSRTCPTPGLWRCCLGSANLGVADPDIVKFFTEPHYNGYPAVLVRLAEVNAADLRQLLTDAWRCAAPRDVVKAPARKLSRSKTKKKS